MKTALKLLVLILSLAIVSCGGEEKKEDKGKVQLKKQTTTQKVESSAATTKASETINLTSKGVGPITNLVLPAEIDQAMVTHGKDVYDKMCTACHRADKKFIGPSPTGIFERRTPEWIMNMILDPEGMVNNDALAKALLIEFNGSPMANQNLTEVEARAVLEYFRTLK